MRIITTEYRGSGFYGNRPKSVRKVEDIREDIDVESRLAMGFLNPVSWDELLAKPKKKGHRSCAR